MDVWNTTFLLGIAYFQVLCHVSFRECIFLPKDFIIHSPLTNSLGRLKVFMTHGAAEPLQLRGILWWVPKFHRVCWGWCWQWYGCIITYTYIYIYNIWGFLKWWYPTTMGFPTENWSFWGVFGVPPFKETPTVVDTSTLKIRSCWGTFVVIPPNKPSWKVDKDCLKFQHSKYFSPSGHTPWTQVPCYWDMWSKTFWNHILSESWK